MNKNQRGGEHVGTAAGSGHNRRKLADLYHSCPRSRFVTSCHPCVCVQPNPAAENATDPFRMTLHLSSRRGGGSSGDEEIDADMDGSSSNGGSSGSNGRGRLSRQEQREVLAELMASKAVQSQIPYW